MGLNTINLRDHAQAGYKLPPQAIPSSAKNDAWKIACMDALDTIGTRQITGNRVRYNDVFRLLEGDFNYKDVTNSSAFLSEVDHWRNQANIDADLKHYGFIEPIVNSMIGEFLKFPNPIQITADDPLSNNDYLDTKKEKLWQAIQEDYMKRINIKMLNQGLNPFKEDFESEEEQQLYKQSVNDFVRKNVPKKIEQEMNSDVGYRPVYIDWAEATLEYDYERYDVEQIDKSCFYEYLATGKCFSHIRVGYDYYAQEFTSINNTFYDDSVKHAEDGDYAGIIEVCSANKIISRLGQHLTKNEIERIQSSKNYSKDNFTNNRSGNINTLKDWALNLGGQNEFLPHPDYYDYKNAQYIQDLTGRDLGFRDEFPNGNPFYSDFYTTDSDRPDLVKYIEGYWVSNQKVGLLTLFNEEINQIETTIVTDEILPDYLKENEIKKLNEKSLKDHLEKPEPNTIVWHYVPQVWKGYKICKENTDLKDDLYVGIEPLPYQIKGESKLYHTKLPIVGIIRDDSFVGRIQQEQIDYNLYMNMARDYMSKELGVFTMIDLASMPTFIKDLGGEEAITKMTDLIRYAGFLPTDSSQGSPNNNFHAVNMDLSAAMLGKMEAAQVIKRMAYEKIGFSPERLATPSGQKTATGIEQSVAASFNQSEVWFDEFANFQKRKSEIHINIAKHAKREGIDDTVNLIDSYKRRTFIRNTDKYLMLRDFKILPLNNSKRRTELEILKDVYMNDNTIAKDLESMTEVINADSFSKILKVARIGKQIADIEREKQRQAEMQQIQMKEAGETERLRLKQEFEAEQNRLDREASVLEKQIVALGFDTEKDRNQNQVADVTEAANQALQQMKEAREARKQQEDILQQRIKNQKDYNLKQRELDIKQESNQVERYKADMELRKAKENKTSAELKAAGKLSSKENN